MAKISYEQLSNNNTTDYKVGFFGIKNREEAIVRFVINTIDDFDIHVVHPITVGDSRFPGNRRVECLRTNPMDPIAVCPLCAAGEKVQSRLYIKMIQYIVENNQIVPKAVIWDRPAYAYAPQLKGYLDNYGPLTNIVCKIIRRGDGLDTKYEIIPNLNPQQYNEQLYPKKFDDFNDFKVLGGIVMDKSADEIAEFMRTGKFPQKTNDTTAQPVYATPTYADSPIAYKDTVDGVDELPFTDDSPFNNPPLQIKQYQPQMTGYPPRNNPTTQFSNTPIQSTDTMPNNSTLERPKRYY